MKITKKRKWEILNKYNTCDFKTFGQEQDQYYSLPKVPNFNKKHEDQFDSNWLSIITHDHVQISNGVKMYLPTSLDNNENEIKAITAKIHQYSNNIETVLKKEMNFNDFEIYLDKDSRYEDKKHIISAWGDKNYYANEEINIQADMCLFIKETVNVLFKVGLINTAPTAEELNEYTDAITDYFLEDIGFKNSFAGLSKYGVVIDSEKQN